MWLLEQRWEKGIARAGLVLAREGLAGTPAEVLAEATYCSVGGLYRRFGSKIGVARTVVRHADAVLCRELQNAACLADEPNRTFVVLRCVWHAAIAFSQSQPDLFAYAQLHWRHPKGTESPVDGASGQTTSFLEGLLEKGVRAGELDEQPATIIRALFWGALIQLVKDRLAGAGHDEVAAFELVWRAIASAARGSEAGRSRADTSHLAPPGPDSEKGEQVAVGRRTPPDHHVAGDLGPQLKVAPNDRPTAQAVGLAGAELSRPGASAWDPSAPAWEPPQPSAPMFSRPEISPVCASARNDSGTRVPGLALEGEPSFTPSATRADAGVAPDAGLQHERALRPALRRSHTNPFGSANPQAADWLDERFAGNAVTRVRSVAPESVARVRSVELEPVARVHSVELEPVARVRSVEQEAAATVRSAAPVRNASPEPSALRASAPATEGAIRSWSSSPSEKWKQSTVERQRRGERARAWLHFARACRILLCLA